MLKNKKPGKTSIANANLWGGKLVLSENINPQDSVTITSTNLNGDSTLDLSQSPVQGKIDNLLLQGNITTTGSGFNVAYQCYGGLTTGSSGGVS